LPGSICRRSILQVDAEVRRTFVIVQYSIMQEFPRNNQVEIVDVCHVLSILVVAKQVTKPLKRLLMRRNIILARDFPVPKGSLRDRDACGKVVG